MRDSIRYGCDILVDLHLKEAAKYYLADTFHYIVFVEEKEIIIFCKQNTAAPPFVGTLLHLIPTDGAYQTKLQCPKRTTER